MKGNQTHKRFIHNCATVAIACDVGNHRPSSFQDFLLPSLGAINFHQQLDIHLNWPKFALTLNRLGIFHRPLIREILKRRAQFEAYNGYDSLECLVMEKLANTDVHHILSDLKRAMDKYMHLLACADNDIIIPMMFKIDTKSKKLLRFTDNHIVVVNSLPHHDNQLL